MTPRGDRGYQFRAVRMRVGGFSTLEVLVALSLMAVVSLVSLAYTSSVRTFSTVALGLIGEHSPAGQQMAARLRTVGSEWIQAQMEYARQLGYEGLCASSNCTFYTPFTDCSGATPQSPPLSEGPAQPPELPYARIVVTWDPNTPVDSSTNPATNYLQLIEVDLYRSQADCQAQTSFMTGYTSVSIR